ncbi:Zinc-binding dehydrogenase-like protein 9 [Elsinoe fawcettii]|nr:Zinc-binding dehydrogenase-like protein 9 [Elsinoe fawcettii]
MANSSIPSTMRAWKFGSTAGGMEKNLKLHKSEPVPKHDPKQHLIRVSAVSLNPVDYKPFEAPILGRLLLRKPMIPAFDVAGHIVTPADGSPLEPGTPVYGVTSSNPLAGGALAEYVLCSSATIVALPPSVSALDAAGAPVAAVTAYQALAPHIHAGSRVFFNGGSGGVGTYAIQIAKILGAHVTVSCSGRNADLCRELSADDVLDYTARPLLEQLRGKAPFDHVVDGVFSDPKLYWEAHTYTTPSAKFVEIAGAPTVAFIRFILGSFLLPSFLGGGKRKIVAFGADINKETLETVAKWMGEGKLRTVRDQVFKMAEVPEAFVKSKSGRARGKILVNVAGEGK